jgi:hypothetical protein
MRRSISLITRFEKARPPVPRWTDDSRLSDIEARFVGRACGKRGADVRPDFIWNRQPRVVIGYR